MATTRKQGQNDNAVLVEFAMKVLRKLQGDSDEKLEYIESIAEDLDLSAETRAAIADYWRKRDPR